MRDLYARLNLSREASPQDIRSRVKDVSDPQLKRAAKKILLHPQRREVYDRNHRTLELIGKLRQELDLTDTANWRETGSDDFIETSDSSQTSASSKNTSTKNASSQDSGSSSSSGRSSEDHRSRTSKGKKSGTGAGPRDPYAETTHQSPSSSTSILGSIAGAFVDAMEGVYGCLVNLVARLAMLALVFAGIGVAVETCNTIEEAIEPDDKVQTAESTEKPSEESNSSTETESSTGKPTDQSSEQESFSVPPEPLPGNGTWWKYTSQELIAPLQISVSEGKHYYVKLTDVFTGETVLTIFIRSGQATEVDVPTGNYNLKYAIGDTWYGHEYLFGPETEYMKADDTLNFEIVGREVRGHRIELIVQQGGNLRTDPIPEKEF